MVSRWASAICDAIVHTVFCIKFATSANTIKTFDLSFQIRLTVDSGRIKATIISENSN